MGLEVSLIFALAEGNFHIRKMKKATFGTSSKMSQNRTLRRQHDSLHFCTLFHSFGTIFKRDATWNPRCPRTGCAGIGEAWRCWTGGQVAMLGALMCSPAEKVKYCRCMK